MKNFIFPLVLAAATFLVAPAFAQVTLFSDQFEAGNLDHWTGKLGGPDHGVIVPDPLNPTNNVLTFSEVNFGGDIFSLPPASVNPAIQQLKLSFDFLALPNGGVAPPEYGGFIGVAADYSGLNPYFMAGTYPPALNVPPDTAVALTADSQWHHYEINLTQFALSSGLTNLQVVLEDWSGLGSVPGDVYFDNVQLTAKLNPAIIAALVPCAGPTTGGRWRNHGAYVSMVYYVTGQLVAAGLLTPEEQLAYTSAAAQSNCGK